MNESSEERFCIKIYLQMIIYKGNPLAIFLSIRKRVAHSIYLFTVNLRKNLIFFLKIIFQ